MSWKVPEGTGARVAIATPVFLLVMLSLAVWVYDTKLRPTRMRPVTSFPAPGLENYVHPGVADPEKPRAQPARHPRIDAAMDAVAREGLPGWPAGAR